MRPSEVKIRCPKNHTPKNRRYVKLLIDSPDPIGSRGQSILHSDNYYVNLTENGQSQITGFGPFFSTVE